MTDKTKLVYSWIGPRGPLWNTELPNLLGFAAASEQCSVNSHNWWNDDTWTTLFRHGNDKFEVTSAFNISYDDDGFFVYPFSLAWRIPFENYFMGNTGLLEFSHMPAHLIQLVRNKNGYILINHSVEAFMGPGYLSSLHSYFSNTHGIPLHKIIYVTGCINSKELYEQYCINNNIPEGKEHRLTVISYPSSQTIFKPNLEDEDEAVYDTETIPNKLFLTWNRRYRNHRIALALMLESLKLIDRTHISFSDVNVERQTKTFEQSIHYHSLQNWGIDVSQETINSFTSRLPLNIDSETNINQMCEDRGNVSRPYYQDSLISLITETNFDVDEVTLTEKSYKPIKEKHPFIIIGVNGALRGLHKAGFRTFNEFWDESYDNIEGTTERLRAIKQVIEDISTWDNDKILDFKRRVKPILEHNLSVLKNSSPRSIVLEINNIIRGNT